MEEEDRGARLDGLMEAYLLLRRQGLAPDLDEYAAAHADVADDLHEMLPALLLMESMKSDLDLDATVEAAPPAPAPPPERVGPYRIVRELGRGGMGVVYEGACRGGGRVAVKVVHPHLAGDDRFVARFLREARLGADLDAPHVVRTIDVGVCVDEGGADVPYLVLAFLEGRSLRAEQAAHGGRLPDARVRSVGADVCRGLAALHARGLVHRDVKPSNIIVVPDGGAVLLDLGIARPLEEAQGLTRTGEFVGSFAYAAPEQFLDDPALLGPWSDLYSLGITLYEVATGCAALEARVPTESSSQDALLHDDVRATLDRLRAREPAARFQTADAARAALLRTSPR